MPGENGRDADPAPAVALNVEIQQSMRDGAPVLVVVTKTAHTFHSLELTPEQAHYLGGKLSMHGQRLSSGLVLPPRVD